MPESQPSPTASSPGAVSRALAAFLGTEAGGGVVLVVATAVALLWANSPWKASYVALWTTDVTIAVGSHHLSLDLRHWVNEGLMAFFFLVVGLEIKRELFEGELRNRRRAALPVVAAAGGMVVPALLYRAVVHGGAGSHGWGIPMATDIAFALGVLALVGRRLPPSLRLFLLTLAVVDDLGAIVVIAVFYSDGVTWSWLGAAAGIVVLVLVARRLPVAYTALLVVLGVALWLALEQAGVSPTLAGVIMGLLAPVVAAGGREIAAEHRDELLDVSTARAAHSTARLARTAVSEVEWLEHALHPWSSFVVVPIFALANAGIALDGPVLRAAVHEPVAWGVVVGLVVGKPVGILAFSWLTQAVGLGELPEGATWVQLGGVAALCGIGFTVSLFVTDLAFTGADLAEAARIGILAASVLASVAGAVVIAFSRPGA